MENLLLSIMETLTNNVHDYDGHLQKKWKRFLDEREDPLPTFNETLDSIFIELKNLRQRYPEFKNGSNLVMIALRLLNEDRNRNYDDKNDIHVEELLPPVWENVNRYDDTGKFLFFEQIIDIVQSGDCSQGRTIRLIQFL